MDAKGIIRRTEDILRSDYQININEADAKQLLGAATRISCLRRKLPAHR